MKYLLIAEKPSLMRDIESCYKKHIDQVVKKIGGTIDFIALSGHVCTNFMPDDYQEWKDRKWRDIAYPMIPNPWQIKAIEDSHKKATLEKIKKIISSYDGIICATDSDTEGYGIYFLLEQYLELSKPTLRFMEHSLTDAEILKSLLNMTDFHQDVHHINTTQSFLLRSRADWLFGMNGTRVMSNKYGKLYKIGRVKSPTIKLVYDNSLAIENFNSKNYYVVIAEYDGFKAVLQDKKEDARFEEKDKIPEFSLEGEVVDRKAEKAYRQPPKLFDLAAVQAEAGSKFKLKPDRTLEIIQSLYEKHKVISYPRTQCRYVSKEKSKEFSQLLQNVRAFPDLDELVNTVTDEDIKRVMKDKNVVNDTEVSKESHDALLPTTNKPNLSSMTEDEKKICHLIFSRLLMQFLGKEEGEKAVLKIKHSNGIFKAEGKTIQKKGWTVLHKEQKDVIIPSITVGSKIIAKKIYHDERKTKAPGRLTQATLINAMRNIATQIDDPKLKKSLAASQGIGTPATRAAIIKDIIDTGYVRDAKEGLYITDEGKSYIESIKELDIVSPVFAAKMDTSIKQIQRGEVPFENAQEEVLKKLYEMIEQVNSMQGGVASQKSMPEFNTNINCPICEKTLRAGAYKYECECGFSIARTILGHELIVEQLEQLCNERKSGPYVFTNKSGKNFVAYLILGEDNKAQFEFLKERTATCPICQKELNINGIGAFCKDCGLKIFRNQRGHALSEEELNGILRGEKITCHDFKQKNGTTYSGMIYLKNGNISLIYGVNEQIKKE